MRRRWRRPELTAGPLSTASGLFGESPGSTNTPKPNRRRTTRRRESGSHPSTPPPLWRHGDRGGA
jgi:hypothetical protein